MRALFIDTRTPDETSSPLDGDSAATLFASMDVHRIATLAAALNEDPGRYDVVFVDIEAPSRSGTESPSVRDLSPLRKLRRWSERAAIVALVAPTDAEGAALALREGADQILVRAPHDGEVVQQALNDALDRRRMQRRDQEFFALARPGGDPSLRRAALTEFLQIIVDQALAHTRAEGAVLVFSRKTLRDRMALPPKDITAGGFAHLVDGSQIPLFELSALATGARRLDEVTSGLKGAELDQRWPAKSLLAVPVKYEDRVIAALFLGHREPGFFKEGQEEAAQALVSWATMACERVLLSLEKERALWTRKRILSVVSHDLRSPLGVLTMAHELMSQVTNEETRSDFQARARRAIDQMLRIIEGILDYAELTDGSLSLDISKKNLTPLFQGLCETWASEASRKQINLSYEVANDLAAVPLDLQQTQKALANIIQEIIKAGDIVSEIRLVAERMKDAAHLRVVVVCQGADADRQMRYFNQFSRMLDEEKSSVGLALAVSKGIFEAHGGSFALNHGDGAAIVFTGILPVR